MSGEFCKGKPVAPAACAIKLIRLICNSWQLKTRLDNKLIMNKQFRNTTVLLFFYILFAIDRDSFRRVNIYAKKVHKIHKNLFYLNHIPYGNMNQRNIKMSQCPEMIFNKVSKAFKKTYTGLKSMLQRFQFFFSKF